MKTLNIIKLILVASFCFVANFRLGAEKPIISYSTPPVFVKDKEITPLSPTNTGGALYSYAEQSWVAIAKRNIGGVHAIDDRNVYFTDDQEDVVFFSGRTSTIKFSGTSDRGYRNGASNDCWYNGPSGIAYNSAAKISYQNDKGVQTYVADTYNNVIRLLDNMGNSSTLAGSGSDSSKDGSGTSASFGKPMGLCIVNSTGDLYVTDFSSGKIRKLVPFTKQVTTIATGITYANQICTDNTNLYVTKSSSDEIIKISISTGAVSVFARVQGAQGICTDGTYVYVGKSGAIYKIEISTGTVTPFIEGTPYSSRILSYANGSVFVTNYQNLFKVSTYKGTYSITPSLPPGLSFDTKTGVISGTPTATSDSKKYTITAKNIDGNSNPAYVTIAVDAVPAISYPAPSVYTVGTDIIALSPTNSSGATVSSYSISPALPAGLNFNTSTGVISGKPTAVSASKPYTVTATNSLGSGTAVVYIKVYEKAPVIRYAMPDNFIKGVSLNLPPTVDASGGTPTSYSISPTTLPAGLSFNTGSGVISGTPTAITASKPYTITAKNSNPTPGTYDFSISVADKSPVITYNSPNVVVKGDNVSLSPTVSASGGTPTGYSISPSLPTGLSFNTTTGLISGKPSVVSPQNEYTVTAINSNPTSGTFKVYITVNDVKPSMSYASPQVYTRGTSISLLNPTNTGGVVDAPQAQVGTLAGAIASGFTDASGTSARFNNPYDVCSDGNGSLYVTDYTNNLIRKIVISSGAVSTFAGSRTTTEYKDGTGLSASFKGPSFICTDGPNLYVSDQLGNKIRKIEISSGVVTTFAGSGTGGSSDGTGTAAQFNQPSGICTDGVNLYVADGNNNKIRKIVIGTGVVTTLAGSGSSGSSNGTGVSATFNKPYGICLLDGNLYVADAGNNLIRKIVISSAEVSTFAGKIGGGSSDGPGASAGFSGARGIFTDGTNLYVSDYGNNMLRKITISNQNVMTLAGATSPGSSDGVGTSARFTNPVGLFSDGTALYVADYGNNMLRKIVFTSGGYTVSPALPTGLSIDPVSGAIGGVPVSIKGSSNYTVTATNITGSGSATVNIGVNDMPPVVSYAASSTFVKGTLIANLIPTNTGGIPTSYSVTSSLPVGLTLNTVTGIISGTPSDVSTTATYTVKATNSGSSTGTTTNLSITVIDKAPVVSYTNSSTFIKGVTITSLKPTNTAGAPTSYSISPALPAGLSFDTSTGIISGKPTALSPLATYTVTAFNTGSPSGTTCTFTLKVVDVAPSGLTYNSPNVYTKGMRISDLNPVVLGGKVEKYSVTPALPAGLLINSASGTISGIPTIATKTDTYTVTAENTGGRTSYGITITVINPATITLGGSLNPFNTCAGSASKSQIFTVTGSYLTGNLLVSAPSGTEISLSSDNSYTSSVTLVPNSGSVAQTTIYIRLQSGVAGTVSGNVSCTSSGAVTKQLSVSGTINGLPAKPVITTSGSTTFCSGGGVELTSSAGASYQWYKDGSVINGATGSRYTAVNPGSYSVVVTNASGCSSVSSSAVSVTVNSIPAATIAEGVSVAFGNCEHTTLDLTANAGSGYSYQWYKDGVALPGQTSRVYSASAAGDYTVQVSSNGCSSVSAVTKILAAPTINNGPTLGICACNSVLLTATDNGYTNPTYQWQLNGVNIAGATSNTYQAATAGTYTLVVSDGTNTATSCPTIITVYPQPVIAIQASPSATVCSGDVSLLSATVTEGTAPYAYQWSVDGTDISGATGSSYSTSTGGDYAVRVTDSNGCVTTSGNTTVTVNSLPEVPIITSGGITTFYSGGSVELTSSAGSTYQWYRNGSAITTNGNTQTYTATAGGSYTVVVTNSNGCSSLPGSAIVVTVNDIVSPSDLSYPIPDTYTKGVTISSLSPTISGGDGDAISYSVSPALPDGLTLDPSSGIISGTPMAVAASRIYTVIASNKGGSTSKELTIVVNDIAPEFGYTTPNIFTNGTSITALTPSNTGGVVVNYSISPALPTGLNLNASTGIISGTPMTISSDARYTVTGSNTGGSFTFDINIQVNDKAPVFSYASPQTFTKGSTITSLTPLSTGGAVESYSVSPSLPSGLILDTTTGVISGTPVGVTESSAYTITGSNTGGNSTFDLVIRVKDIAPVFSYTSSNVFTKGMSVTMSPVNTGGTVLTYSVSPSLPIGLSLDAITGTISGTPVSITSRGTYTITGTNDGGELSFDIDITVNDIAPVISYTTNNVYTRGIAISPLEPSNAGGTVLIYSLDKSLPAGLSLDPVTGVISGTPTVATGTSTYKVTAENSGGSSSYGITITVINPPIITLSGSLSSLSTCLGTVSGSQAFTVEGSDLTDNLLVTAPEDTEISLSSDNGYSSSITLVPHSGSVATTTIYVRLSGTSAFWIPDTYASSITGTISCSSTGAVTQTLTVAGTVNDLPTKPVITINGSTAFCSGGSVELISSEGANYQWYKNGLAINGATSSSYTVVNSGNYSVVVTNASGCSSSSSSEVEVIVNPVPEATIAEGVTVAFGNCENTVLNLTANSGNTYGYQWYKDGVALTGQTSQVYSVTEAGDYSVSVNNTYGCSTLSPITRVLAVPTIDNGPSLGICACKSVQLNATDNGYTNPTYQWQLNGVDIVGATSTSYEASTAGSYTVVVSDGTNTATSCPTVIIVYPQPVIEVQASPSATVCSGDVSMLDATVTEGTAPYAYQWSVDGTDINGATSSSYSTSTGGNYAVRVTDSNGCVTTSGNTPVIVNGLPDVPLITPGGITTFYSGGSVELTSSAGSTYQWYRNGIAITTNGNMQTYTARESGLYTVIVTSGSGCSTASASGVEVTVKPIVAPYNLVYPTPNIFTLGVAITSLAPTVSGGAGDAISYSVSPALPDGLTLDSSNGVISGTPTAVIATAIYTITAANSGGHSSYNITITVVNPPVITVAGSFNAFSTCVGSASVSQVFTVEGSDLTDKILITAPSGVEISLSPNSGYVGSISLTPNSGSVVSTMIYVRLQGTVEGIISDNISCISSGARMGILSFSGTVHSLPEKPVITIKGSTTFCGGESVELISSAGANYQWYKNGLVINGATSSSYTVVNSGNYSVVVTNASGCSSASSSEVQVTVNPVPEATIAEGVTVAFGNCESTTLTLTANSGSGYSYQWYKDGVALTGQTSRVYSVTQVGEYSVSVSNPNGCSTLSTFTRVLSVPTIDNGPSLGICACNSVLLTATDNGFTNPTYQWQLNGVNIADATSGTYQAAAAGTYTLVVSDGTNTATSCPTIITVYPQPVIAIQASPSATVCSGDVSVLSATVTEGTAPYIYQWSVDGTDINGATSSSYSVSTGGDYAVKVTDSNGCVTTSATTLVTVNSLPDVPVITPGGITTFYSGGSVALTSSAGSTYQWYRNGNVIATNGNTQTYTVTESGLYTVVVTSGSGCSTASASGIEVTVKPVIAPYNLSYSTPNTFKKGQAINNLSPTVSGGDGDAIRYSVSPALPIGLSLNATTGIISGTPTAFTAAATYTVTASNRGGSTSFDINIIVRVEIEIAGDKNGDGEITPPEIAGDVNENGKIDDGEIAGDIDGDKKITAPEIAGDANGDGKITLPEIAGDVNADGKIDDGEIAGDIDGDKKITVPEIAGDANGDGKITLPEIAGDVNGDGKIDAGEIGGDTDGDKKITAPEIAGDANGDGKITLPEIAGDINANGTIDNGEIAGDINGDGKIIFPEISGDINGNGKIDNGEISGDINGDGKITSPEIAGDINGNGIIDTGEIAGDINGDGKITSPEIAGDINGNGRIDDGEISGDINGDKKITSPEIVGDLNGNGKIDDGEIAGDKDGDGKVILPELGGDANGDGSIVSPEICGDVNADGKISSGEVAGDLNGDKAINKPELVGDVNGNIRIEGSEILGDANANGVIDNGEIDGRIVTISPLTSSDNALVACENTNVNLPYSILVGVPVKYKIVFDAAALAAGFNNIPYTDLPTTDTNPVWFSVPEGIAAGSYHGLLYFLNGYDLESEGYVFDFSVNLSGNLIIKKFDNLILCDNSSKRFVSYQWYKDGVAIPGATRQFYLDPKGLTGSYAVEMTTQDGQKLITCGKAYNTPVSKSVKVYPNPVKSTEEFTVQMDGFSSIELKNARLRVYDTKGNLVYNQEKVDTINSFVPPSTTGVYVGHVLTATGEDYTFKVVVGQ